MHANNNRERTIEDYLDTITVLRAVYPTSRGPADITLEQAKAFKSSYQAQGYVRQKKSEPKIWKGRGRKPKARPEPVAHARAARTVDSRLRKLRSLWGRWFIQELGYVTANPWQGVTAPKLDKLTPRYLSAEEVAAFFAWLAQRWQGWRLPALFCEVKSFLGNRILELCSLTTDQLQAGRVVFAADGTKGRKERQAVLPPEVYAELKASAGPAYVWEKFPEQLRERLQALHRPHHKVLPDFSPARLKGWIQDEIDDYCKAHPEVKRFSAHGFRKRAMTQAWRLKIRPEEAAVAFGCNPRTMMAHYVSMDEVATADAVLKAVAEALDPRARERVQEATPDRPDGTGE
jgi:integrase